MNGTPPTGPTVPADSPALHREVVRLTYADCDPAGIIYYAAWFPWMERIQSEWFFRNGLRQDQLLDTHGFSTVTRHAECEYLAQVGLFDTIEVSLRKRHLGSTSVTLGHEMWWREGARPAARGSITLVTLSTAGTPIEVPDAVREALARTIS